MSAGIKVTNGDISFDQKTGRVDVIFDEEKAVQLAIHTISFNTRPDGKGAGLNELVGQANNPIFFRSRLDRAIRNSFGIVIEDQYNTPRITKTQNELIDEVRDLIIARNQADPRNHDIELTVVLLNGDTFSVTGILG